MAVWARKTSSNFIGLPAMKTHLYRLVTPVIAVALIAGCAVRSVPTDRLERVAVITSGDINLRSVLRFGPKIKVIEIDGISTPKPYGPIELEPGTHKVTMTCGNATNTVAVNALAGEEYRFAMVTNPGVEGCSASLSRTREASPAARQEAERRAKAELAQKEQRARAERAKAEPAKTEQLVRMERAKPGRTPEAPSDQRDVSAAIERWAAAWSRKDVGAYLAAYAKDFVVPRGQSRRRWEAQRRARIVGKSRIEVKIEALQISVSGNTATARFRQQYRSNRYSDTTDKTLTLVKNNRQWLIQREQ